MRLYFAFFFWAVALAAELPSEGDALALRRIADFWEEGEYQIAKDQMESFLAEFPESPYADTLRMALGDLFLREKSYQVALNYYAQIANPTLAEQVPLKRMQCLYHLQWFATLADECESYLKNLTPDLEKERLDATYFLAIALYQQCLNPAKDEPAIQLLAERAKPYFEILANSELSEEAASAFAHLRCILKDFKGASEIYIQLSENTENPEDLLFQAAIIQTKYDKDLAIKTFKQIGGLQSQLAREANYNLLILSFDQGRYEEILSAKEDFLQSIPEEKQALAHLIFGQSLLASNRCFEAVGELNAFLDGIPNNTAPESMRPALLHLLEAAFRAENLELLDQAIDRLVQFDPVDPNVPKAKFSRAQLLKKAEKFEEAKAELISLLAQFPQFVERPQASFEILMLEMDHSHWTAAREAAAFFLQEYPSHELSSYAWKYLVAASSELALLSAELKTQFIQDLEQILAQTDLAPSEAADLHFYLAKTFLELGSFSKASELVKPLLDSTSPFAERANAELLLALCYRNGEGNQDLFCHWAEEALSHDAKLIPLADQHIALFNAYLARSSQFLEKIGQHLMAAFRLKAPIELPNLLWLANHSYEQFEKDPTYAGVALEVISYLLERPDLNSREIRQETIYLEPLILKAAKLLQHFGQNEESISLLERLDAQYRSAPLAWNCLNEVKCLLAETYDRAGSLQLAESLFDEISSSSLFSDRFAASAALQSARIKRSTSSETVDKILSKLKDIVLQKNLENEPVHLEAALEYIDLQNELHKDEQKRLQLLVKTKEDFESQEDLLSKDYHVARSQFEGKNRIYLDYMRYLDALILQSQAQLDADVERQKELQAKAKEILLQMSEADQPLRSRVEKLLH